MQVHRDIEALPAFRNAVVTIGTLDGVHMGHRQIIDKLKTEAKAINGETVIITFHPHPRIVISSPIPGIRLINTLDEKIGLLDPSYYAYYEDVDLCFRARNVGFKIIVAQKSIIYHFGSISFGQNSIRQCYLLERNRIKFLTKFFFGLDLFNSLVVFDFHYTIKKLSQFLNRDLAIQRESKQSSKTIPNSNFLVTFKAMANQFIGKILAFLSLLFIVRGK